MPDWSKRAHTYIALQSLIKRAIQEGYRIDGRSIPPLLRAVVRKLSELRSALTPLTRVPDVPDEEAVVCLQAAYVRLLEILNNKQMMTLMNSASLSRGLRSNDKPFHTSLLTEAVYALLPSSTDFISSSLVTNSPSAEISVSVALRALAKGIEDDLSNPQLLAALEEGKTLKKVLPAQQLGPAQFEIVNGRIRIQKRPNVLDINDKNAVANAREHLLASGAKILEELKSSNCDKRLITTIESLQTNIETEENIVKTGLANLEAMAMCDSFSQELPSAVVAMLRGYSRGVELFAAQFPEWNQFVDNANSAQLSTQDISHIHQSVQKVKAELVKETQLADPEVPKLFAYLDEMIDNPGKARKRFAFAALRTIGNFVGTIFSVCGDFLKQTASKTVDGLSTALSKTLVRVALAGALVMLPVSQGVPEIKWVKDAIEIVQKELGPK